MTAGPLVDPTRRRGELAWLAGIVAVSVGVQVWCALRWHLGFDEALHFFQVTVQPWRQYVSELRHEVHPPLLYELLRCLSWPTDSTLVPRAPSILAGAVSVWATHGCARALGLGAPAALLAALVAGVAPPAVSMAANVRGYMLANAFIVLTMWAALRARPVACALAAVLALASEYPAVLPVVAILVWQWRRIVRSPAALLLLALGFAAVAAVYVVQRTGGSLQHVGDLLRGERALLAFATQALADEVVLFVPFDLPHGLALALGLGAIGVGTVAATRRQPVAWVGTFTLVALLLLGSASMYPFGGRLRHQFVLWPFLVLAGAQVFDRVTRPLGPRAGPLLALAAAVTLLFASIRTLARGSLDEVPQAPLAGEHVPVLRATVPVGEPIVTDYFTSVLLFLHSRHGQWRHDDHLHQFKRFAVATEPPQVIWRDDTWAHAEPPFARLAALLRERGLERLTWVSLAKELYQQPADPEPVVVPPGIGLRILEEKRLGASRLLRVARQE